VLKFAIPFLLLLSFNIKAQTNFDSLYSVWLNEQNSNSLRTEAYNEYIYFKYVGIDIDSALLKSNELVNFGLKNNYPKAVSTGYQLIGEAYLEEEINDKASEFFLKALKVAEQSGFVDTKVSLINTIGALYSDMGNFPEGLKFFERGLSLSKVQDDKETMEMCVSNIGGIYYSLENYSKALEYLEKGLELENEMNDTIGYATSLNLISIVLLELNKNEEALQKSNQALEIFETLNNEEGILESYFNLGDMNLTLGNFNVALEYFNMCLNSDFLDESDYAKMNIYDKLGNVYLKIKDYEKAQFYCKQSLDLAKKIGFLVNELSSSQCLYLTNKSLNNSEKALIYIENVQNIEDSLNIQKTNNRLQSMEVEKQFIKDSISTSKEKKILELEYREQVRKKNHIRNIIIVIAFFILLMAGGLYNRWKSVKKSKAIIEKEKERSENLLLNILPADIAKELKEKGKADARDFEMVSILFTDFKGFTQASEKLSAQELVGEINTCFQAFDHIMGKYGIEKIKTIGDAYMAAGGLPVPKEDSVKKTILAALEMQDFITQRKILLSEQNKTGFEMRVGVHTGPIVAGIVGVKKFQYDIWGDTVNTASRMESHGEVEKVNISETTYNLLKHHKEFIFEKRAKIEVKGKGKLDMWFVKLVS
jgi:class 3 adenylate cyclase